MTDLENIRIGVPALIGMAVAGVVKLLLPFVFWIVWRKKTKAAWIPLLAGILGYLVIGTVRGVARVLLLTPLQDTPWLFYIWQAVFAGVFEEGGRYFIFRYALPNYDRYRDAASYGIGHGGLEHLIVDNGGVFLYGFLTGLAYYLHGLAAFTPGEPAAFLMEGQDTAGMIGVLEGISENTLMHCLFTAVNSVTSLLFQCCMSVLVFTAVRYAGHLKWLGAAFLLHVVTDIIPAFHFAGNLSATEVDVLLLLFTAGVVYLTYRVRESHDANSVGDIPDLP